MDGKQVESLIRDGAEVITDTVPARVFEAAQRFYVRRGYEFMSWRVVGSGGLVKATFERVEEGE